MRSNSRPRYPRERKRPLPWWPPLGTPPPAPVRPRRTPTPPRTPPPPTPGVAVQVVFVSSRFFKSGNHIAGSSVETRRLQAIYGSTECNVYIPTLAAHRRQTHAVYLVIQRQLRQQPRERRGRRAGYDEGNGILAKFAERPREHALQHGELPGEVQPSVGAERRRGNQPCTTDETAYSATAAAGGTATAETGGDGTHAAAAATSSIEKHGHGHFINGKPGVGDGELHVRDERHGVALQVEFERSTLKPVFHLIGYRLWV
jgi:hypothetical protein